MKKITFLLLIVSAGIFITSCEKPANEPSIQGNVSAENTLKPVLTPEYREALITAINSYEEQFAGERSANFIPAFFTSDYFGFLDDNSHYLATFSTALDADDFYRENPDGTVTVHIASDQALSELFDYQEFMYYSGLNGHMVMHYTGPVEVVPIVIGGVIIGYFNLVVPNQDSPATVWHGDGYVQDMFLTQTKYVVAHLTANASWKKVKRTINVN